ncbi:MAG: adenosylmethionine decarboxylase [Deltaproteobacteria bacterium]|nr:adenosylmethionine decarboxylase [Deltaproteobacteria bacterium]
MKPTGTQLVAEFFNCSKDIINDREAIEQVLRDGIGRSGIDLISINSHCYDPIGITSIAVISESHVAIHTYPEARHASIDIFTCSRNEGCSLKILEFFKERLAPRTTRTAEISRGNPIEVTNTNWITDDTGSAGFDIRYHIEREIFSKKSKYQDILIIENESFGRMLFLDNDLQIAEHDAHLYNSSMVRPLMKPGLSLDHVAILGGGDGGVLREVLKLNPSRVTLIDIDEEVVTACRTHLSAVCGNAFDDARTEVIYDDAFRFLDQDRRYDALIYDLTMHPEAFIDMDREEYLDLIFGKTSKALKQGGALSAQCCSGHDHETREISERILTKHFSDVTFSSTFIPSYCSPWVYASATRK